MKRTRFGQPLGSPYQPGAQASKFKTDNDIGGYSTRPPAAHGSPGPGPVWTRSNKIVSEAAQV